jgi:hypothetical protein
VNVLFAIPLLPLAVAAWLALSPRASQLAGGWVVAIVAAIPFSVAMLASMERIDLPQLLVGHASALQLDETARAALLLFGGLWLTAGLLQTRAREHRPNTILMLVALSGATTLALADGGPLVYAGMSMTGYGLCGILAGESVHAWRRAGRVLIVLLVISDLLVFEMLLASTAKPELGMQRGLLLLGLLALMLRAGVPPAHVWLPPALAFVTTPTAVLLVMAPAAALVGALKILPGGFPEIGMLCVLVGVAGAIWATIVGLVQVQARTTLAYALAATAAVLLMAVAAGAGLRHPAPGGIAVRGRAPRCSHHRGIGRARTRGRARGTACNLGAAARRAVAGATGGACSDAASHCNGAQDLGACAGGRHRGADPAGICAGSAGLGRPCPRLGSETAGTFLRMGCASGHCGWTDFRVGPTTPRAARRPSGRSAGPCGTVVVLSLALVPRGVLAPLAGRP